MNTALNFGKKLVLFAIIGYSSLFLASGVSSDENTGLNQIFESQAEFASPEELYLDSGSQLQDVPSVQWKSKIRVFFSKHWSKIKNHKKAAGAIGTSILAIVVFLIYNHGPKATANPASAGSTAGASGSSLGTPGVPNTPETVNPPPAPVDLPRSPSGEPNDDPAASDDVHSPTVSKKGEPSSPPLPPSVHSSPTSDKPGKFFHPDKCEKFPPAGYAADTAQPLPKPPAEPAQTPRAIPVQAAWISEAERAGTAIATKVKNKPLRKVPHQRGGTLVTRVVDDRVPDVAAALGELLVSWNAENMGVNVDKAKAIVNDKFLDKCKAGALKDFLAHLDRLYTVKSSGGVREANPWDQAAIPEVEGLKYRQALAAFAAGCREALAAPAAPTK